MRGHQGRKDFQVSGLDNHVNGGTRNGETGYRRIGRSRCTEDRLGSNCMWDVKEVKSTGWWILSSIASSRLEVCA